MPRRPKTRNRFEEIRKKRAELTELEKEIIAAISANELTESERQEQESHRRYAAADAKVRRRKKDDPAIAPTTVDTVEDDTTTENVRQAKEHFHV